MVSVTVKLGAPLMKLGSAVSVYSWKISSQSSPASLRPMDTMPPLRPVALKRSQLVLFRPLAREDRELDQPAATYTWKLTSPFQLRRSSEVPMVFRVMTNS